VSALSGRPVRLTNLAVVGAVSADLGEQVRRARELVPGADVAVIMIGANDVTHRITTATAVRHLGQAVRDLVAGGTQVVVGTCPDLGTIEPVAQPLRLMARRWSRDLAAAQTVAVVEAGGRTVSLGDLIGPEFAEHPLEMFSHDRFHPSPAGYARAASALLPSVCAVLGLEAADSVDRRPERRRGEGIGPVAIAAGQAVRDPGTEVSATEVAGQHRGPRGPWAVLLRRRRDPVVARLPSGDAPPHGPGPGAAGDVPEALGIPSP
jgi:lysophospholipase L1-like esterase